MFTVRAGYSDQVEVKTSAERVREFFADIQNFADLMPGITSIHTDAKGVAHWKIQADIPLVGQMVQKFAVELTEESEERIEWFPVKAEAQNFLRFSADFLEKAKNTTVVHFTQMVELRRKSARDLHMSQTLVTRMLRNTGEIGRPTTIEAYRLKISFVAKSIMISMAYCSHSRSMPAKARTFYFILFSPNQLIKSYGYGPT